MMNKLFRMDKDCRPYTRWWWFSNKIEKSDLERQICWAREQGFGGVEIAFVYPLPNRPKGVRFLSPEWSELCSFARKICDREGLACDFSFGTLWPFGGTFIPQEYASKRWDGPSSQRLDRSWEIAYEKEPGKIVDHLSKDALIFYSNIVGKALAPALESNTGTPYNTNENPLADCLFCDSWEVEPEGLWTDGFGDHFERQFGYRIEPFMAELDQHPNQRYEYRKLLSQFVLENFYISYTDVCHSLGSASRVQCHGAPTDLIRAYGAVDIPETETVLFDPEFASFAASAAALTNKRTVSAEAFTCLYGWNPYPGPAPYEDQELIGDLKLTADALFASGVNHIVWHGMPYQGKSERNRFYASVHVGEDSALAKNFLPFNNYLTKISEFMKKGKTFAQIACYYPMEDAFMAGKLPMEKRRPSSLYYWEMQEYKRPLETLPYGSLWIDSYYLDTATVDGNTKKIKVGNHEFDLLYLDVQYLEPHTLQTIVVLVELGARVVLKRDPEQPGTKRDYAYSKMLETLRANKNCVSEIPKNSIKALIDFPNTKPEDRPPFWVRKDMDDFYFFISHPSALKITYPVPYNLAMTSKDVILQADIQLEARHFAMELHFHPLESILLQVHENTIKPLDLGVWC